MALDKSQLIKRKPRDVRSSNRTTGFRLAKTDEMSIEDFHLYINARYARKSQRRLCFTLKLIDQMNVSEFGSDETEAFNWIVGYFERNHFLPGSYMSWLKKLYKGMKINDIIPLEAQAMTSLFGRRKF